MRENGYSKDVILILAASFFFLCCPMLVTPLITGYSGTVGASADFMGFIGGLMNLCSLVCRPVVGNLADRVCKFKLALAGVLCMALACLGYAVSQSTALIVVSRLFHGVGFACCTVSMSTWLSNLLPRDRVGAGMGLYGMMNALAMAAAPSIGIGVYQALGYHAAFFAALVFCLASAAIIPFVADRGAPRLERRAVTRPLRLIDKNVLPIAAIIMLFTMPYCATQSFLVSYVEDRAIDVSVSLFFPVYAVALLLLRMGLKNYFDTLPFRVFLFGSAACALTSILCLAFMRSNIALLAGAVFMAGGYGIMCSVCQSTAILLAGEGRRGLANGTYYIGLDLGMSLGPLAGGLLFGHMELRFFYPTLLITVPAALAVYFLAMRGRKQ